MRIPESICLAISMVFLAAGATASAAAPQIVFVPGFLGSKIKVGDEFVWGGGRFDDAGLQFSADQNATAEAMERTEVEFLGLRYEESVYEDLFRVGASLAATADMVPFNYDWRQSNVRSAEQLAQFLCGLDARQGFILIGHSMGGLVIKHWLLRHRQQPCASDRPAPKVNKVAYLATPHFGSVSAFTSLVDHASINEGWDWLVARGLNTFGFSFDSIYELLPVDSAFEESANGSQRCASKQFADVTLPAVATVGPGSDKPVRVDLFSVSTYEKLGIYERFPLLGGMQARNAVLKDKLDRARTAICSLLAFEDPADIQFHYMAGQGAGEMKTARGLTFFEDDPHRAIERRLTVGNTVFPYVIEYSYGDGTVDRDAALGAYNAVLTDRPNVSTETANAGHQDIVNSLDVKTMIASFRGTNGGYRKTILAAATMSPDQFASTINKVAATSLQPGQRAEIVDLIVDSNVWTALGSQARYDLAKRSNNALLFEAAARDIKLDPIYSTWALQNAGTIYAKSNLATDAARAYNAALELSTLLPAEKKLELQPKIYSSLGWVYLEQGDEAKASSLFNSALMLEPNSNLPILGLERIGSPETDILLTHSRNPDGGNL